MKLKKLLMVSAMVLTGSLMSAVEAAPDQINIAYVKDPFNLQNIVMKQHQSLEKEFQKDGIKINWVSINSGAQQAQAMAAGSLDVSAVMNTASLLMANGAGNKVLVATGVARPTQVFAVVGKAGQQMKIEDLKGKKVAGPKGTVLHQVLVAALKSKGMSINDVEFIQMDPSKAYAALMGKHVDAALLAASLIIKSNQAGAKTVVTADGLVNPLLVMAVSEKFAKENSALLERIVKVHRQTTKWIYENYDQAIAMGAKEAGVSLQDADKLAKWSHYFDVITDEDLQSLKSDQAFLLENDMMQNKVNTDQLVLPIARQ
ncbi:ABC transporter substrate-binding protein [Parasutterella secunda]|uniref:NrtA/SsuA/CpmA family ABC transporter substrate-binding protein n=1 Tax=Parasutterella secunda TaxID=626947 RepID=A0ABS2GPG5_9BURK|nr:NrtA/SsuA/CpmA family ABC transporter substrate-binding protein [Parasutterella secunda]MBM6927733.1 NrtA/SsuA/CpmA family ABC transporter substrate-binding protein [Parasutterella secunda]